MHLNEPPEPIASEITFDQFQVVDFRVGKVLEASRVPKSTKLLKLMVNFGAFQRQILAGVGETFEPEALVGKQYMFVVNLAPRKMMGLESHGMMLATGPDSKSLSLVSPDQEVPDGSKVG